MTVESMMKLPEFTSKSPHRVRCKVGHLYVDFQYLLDFEIAWSVITQDGMFQVLADGKETSLEAAACRAREALTALARSLNAEIDATAWPIRSDEPAPIPLWLTFALRKLHEQVDLTDPGDPIGIALTNAGLERCP